MGEVAVIGDEPEPYVPLLPPGEREAILSEWLAERCGVSHPFVAGIREELSGDRCQMPEKREVERGGVAYEMAERGS